MNNDVCLCVPSSAQASFRLFVNPDQLAHAAQVWIPRPRKFIAPDEDLTYVLNNRLESPRLTTPRSPTTNAASPPPRRAAADNGTTNALVKAASGNGVADTGTGNGIGNNGGSIAAAPAADEAARVTAKREAVRGYMSSLLGEVIARDDNSVAHPEWAQLTVTRRCEAASFVPLDDVRHLRSGPLPPPLTRELSPSCRRCSLALPR